MLQLLINEAEIQLPAPAVKNTSTKHKGSHAASTLSLMGEAVIYREKSVFVKSLDINQKQKKLSRSEEITLFSKALLVSDLYMTGWVRSHQSSFHRLSILWSVIVLLSIQRFLWICRFRVCVTKTWYSSLGSLLQTSLLTKWSTSDQSKATFLHC